MYSSISNGDGRKCLLQNCTYSKVMHQGIWVCQMHICILDAVESCQRYVKKRQSNYIEKISCTICKIYTDGHEFKPALVNIWMKLLCEVWGVSRNDEPTDNYHPSLPFPSSLLRSHQLAVPASCFQQINCMYATCSTPNCKETKLVVS